LNQLIGQIKEPPYFDGNPSELSRYIARVEYLLQLYPTQDVRQIHIVYGAIERTIVDSAQRVIEEEKSNTWITTKAALIKAFKDHRPYEDIIQHVRDTQYQGSISKFVNELQFRSSKVNSKLELESDQIERSIYTNFLNKTIKGCIERKLRDRLYNSYSKKDISTLSNLKEPAMILGHWDSDPFDNYKPKRHDNRRNSGSNLSHQNHYYQKYNSQTHNYPRHSYNNNLNNSTNPEGSTNRNQIPPRNQGNYHGPKSPKFPSIYIE